MRTTASISTLAALGLLVLSTPAADAAPASIGKVSQNGSSVSVKLANPNGYKVRGSVSLVSGQQLVARRRSAIKAHRSATVRLRVPSGAPTRITVVTRLGRPGSKADVSRKRITLARAGRGTGKSSAGTPVGSSRGSTGAGKPAAGRVPGATPGAGTTPPPAQPSNRWTATTPGGDQFPLIVQNGQISVASPIDMGVICNQTGEYVYTAQSMEHFDLDSGWTVGNQDEIRTLDTTRLNVLMDSQVHRVSYKLSSSRSGDTITGALYQSFFTSKYNPFTYRMSYVNCAGTAEFTAHPAA